jgi:hypothetical protein
MSGIESPEVKSEVPAIELKEEVRPQKPSSGVVAISTEAASPPATASMGEHVAEDCDETKLSVIEEVVHILKEAYNPSVIQVKLFPTIKIRAMKMCGLVINQQVGKFLLGWNGKENRIYDAVGAEVEKLFLQLYGHPLGQKDVQRFIHRRLHYAFITAVSTLIQMYFTYHAMVGEAYIVSLIVAPITMLERQWATSVTKNPPRLLRHVVVNQLQWPLSSIAATQVAAAKYGQADEGFLSWRTPLRVRATKGFLALMGTEMFVGFIQFCCGLALMTFPLYLVRHPELKHGDIYPGYSVLFFLNCIRMGKELCNWISPAIEKFLTPMKYAWGDRTLVEFAAVITSIPEECLLAMARPCHSTPEPSTAEEGRTPVVIKVDRTVEDHNERLHHYASKILGPTKQLPYYLTVPKISDEERLVLNKFLLAAAA